MRIPAVSLCLSSTLGFLDVQRPPFANADDLKPIALTLEPLVRYSPI